MTGRQGAAPGWYPDPGNPGGFRWWNGTAWEAASTPAAWTRGSWTPGPREPWPDQAMTVWSLVMLVVAAVATALALGYGVVEGIYFESTSGAVFRAWTTEGFRVAGGVGLLVCLGVFVTWLATRRDHPRFAVTACAGALVVVLAAVLAAWGSHLSRSDPVPDERAIAAAFPVPAGWGAGRESVVRTSPPGAIDPDPPRVDRVIDVNAPYTSVCSAVEGSFRGWGKGVYVPLGGSARNPAITLRTGQACDVTGESPQGWSLYISVRVRPSVIGPGTLPGTALIPDGVSRVTVEVAPPGV